MARKAKVGPRRKRGRPYDPHARRHSTTRSGRRGEIDRGSLRLRARKLALTLRDDIEMTAAGILYGRGHLDNAQYSTLGRVTRLLQHVSRAMGRGTSVNGLWLAIVAAGSRNATYTLPLTGDHGARATLAWICRRLDGSRDLVLELAEEGTMPPICVRAAEHRLTPRDAIRLELLRQGLDGIAAPRSGGFDEAP
jgi:hypothetical protein